MNESDLKTVYAACDVLRGVATHLLHMADAADVLGNETLADRLGRKAALIDESLTKISDGVNGMVRSAVVSADQATANMMHAIIAVAGSHPDV